MENKVKYIYCINFSNSNNYQYKMTINIFGNHNMVYFIVLVKFVYIINTNIFIVNLKYIYNNSFEN